MQVDYEEQNHLNQNHRPAWYYLLQRYTQRSLFSRLQNKNKPCSEVSKYPPGRCSGVPKVCWTRNRRCKLLSWQERSLLSSKSKLSVFSIPVPAGPSVKPVIRSTKKPHHFRRCCILHCNHMSWWKQNVLNLPGVQDGMLSSREQESFDVLGEPCVYQPGESKH